MNIDQQELEDLIAEAIADSFGPDWSHRDGARSVVQAFIAEGLAVVEAPPKWNRGDECPSSPTGKHIVDSTMESGPNNCFHCEGRMP
jgi:hypothetical protein